MYVPRHAAWKSIDEWDEEFLVDKLSQSATRPEFEGLQIATTPTPTTLPVVDRTGHSSREEWSRDRTGEGVATRSPGRLTKSRRLGSSSPMRSSASAPVIPWRTNRSAQLRSRMSQATRRLGLGVRLHSVAISRMVLGPADGELDEEHGGGTYSGSTRTRPFPPRPTPSRPRTADAAPGHKQLPPRLMTPPSIVCVGRWRDPYDRMDDIAALGSRPWTAPNELLM